MRYFVRHNDGEYSQYTWNLSIFGVMCYIFKNRKMLLKSFNNFTVGVHYTIFMENINDTK